jgi:hypothetical protein
MKSVESTLKITLVDIVLNRAFIKLNEISVVSLIGKLEICCLLSCPPSDTQSEESPTGLPDFSPYNLSTKMGKIWLQGKTSTDKTSTDKTSKLEIRENVDRDKTSTDKTSTDKTSTGIKHRNNQNIKRSRIRPNLRQFFRPPACKIPAIFCVDFDVEN